MILRGAIFLAGVAITAFGPALAWAEILIATAGPMTGQYAWFGEQYARGAEMAVDDINAAGGVLGETVRIIIGDDACDPDQAVAVANSLANDGVVFVAGHYCSHSSIPASKVYENAGILMISPASTNPKLTDEGGPNVFRVCGRDDLQGTVAGDYLTDHWGDKKIAILHDQTTYGLGLADETRKRLNERGVAEAMFEAYEPGLRDYSALISKMQAAGIDVFYVGGYSTEAALMLRQARLGGYEVQLISGDALATDEFWMITGPSGEGARMTFFPDPRNNPEAAEVAERFRARYFEPVGYTLYAYGAVQVWAQAIEKAGTLELDAVIEALQSHQFDTILGEIGFDEKGDITASGFVWYVWKNGEYVLAE
jgi:branched-chain amino acid transport system substrate-binding protein